MNRFLLVSVVCLGFGCNDKGGSATIPGTSPGTGVPTGTPGGTVFTTAEFGLDQRPANPSCVAPDRPQSSYAAELVRVYPNVSFAIPTWIGTVPSVPDTWFVAEQAGRIVRFDDNAGVASSQVVLDIRAEVSNPSNEEGLLGVAFHPDFANNGEIYVYFTGSGSTLQLWRAVSPDGGQTASLDQQLVSIPDPFWNHNGGALAFGPDGYLYWGLGDGGSGGDPGNRAQNLDEWHGKIHRIDVNSGNPYAIPADNPFAAGGGRAEVYAWGFRNPWRFAFDAQTGELWVGDVGQNDWEEVDKVVRGGNYGWRIMEGTACYNPANCSDAGLVRPYVTYANNGGASVIGGVVYYGAEIPELNGAYLYSDISYGDVNAVVGDPVTGLPTSELVTSANRSLSHFATAPDGEVVAIDYYSGGVYRLQRVGAAPVNGFPQKLSDTGCMNPNNTRQPGDMLVPYDVNHAFWSDGAEKERFMAIPDGTTITVGADGDWEFPIGSVLIKHLEVGGERVETRLMVRHADGDWAGYAYAWDADGQDATLLPGGLLVDDLPGGASWSVPNRDQCLQCHTPAAGGSLGLETAQLNGMANYPATGRRANQLATLDHIGFFSAAIGDPGALPALPAREDAQATEEEAARAWLHVNCSQCHRPGGPSRGDLDFRWDTALADTNACDATPDHGDLGLGGAARVIAPGNAADSVMVARISRRDAYQMPPIATAVVDDVGVDAITAWVNGLASCP